MPMKTRSHTTYARTIVFCVHNGFCHNRRMLSQIYYANNPDYRLRKDKLSKLPFANGWKIHVTLYTLFFSIRQMEWSWHFGFPRPTGKLAILLALTIWTERLTRSNWIRFFILFSNRYRLPAISSARKTSDQTEN